jgi:hypothetical protein
MIAGIEPAMNLRRSLLALLSALTLLGCPSEPQVPQPPPASAPAPAPASASVSASAPVPAPAPASGCAKQLFVPLFMLSNATPRDFDFPSTRAAIKGHVELAGARFVEIEDQGKRVFGAIVPSREVGEKLAAIVARTVPGGAPPIACQDATPKRELAIDLVTGDLKSR